ncbi:MAG: hypothetical protein ACFB9M_12425 [Myxococcota bacterium]
MKLVVTILQARRAVLPHVFVKYILPKMRAIFPGEVEAVIVQHRSRASGGRHALESGQLGDDKLDLVERWTREGRYAGADVIGHTVDHPPYPSIPGVHRCVQESLRRGADYHLWLEDDALVFDQECDRWDALLGEREVGVYRRFHFLNSAYLLTRPSFDQRIVERLADYRWWTWSRRIEPFLRNQKRTKRAYLAMHHAVRYHHRYYPYTGLRYVVDALRDWAPEALPLLDVDFGKGCQHLPPVTAEEMRAHARADGAKPFDRALRLREAIVERFLLPEGLPTPKSARSD